MPRVLEPSRLLLLLAPLLIGGCAGERTRPADDPLARTGAQTPGETKPPRIPEPDEGRTQTDILETRTLTVGPARIEAWIANRAESRALGLMHVREMDENAGMLFVYSSQQHRAFWMKNTYIPLSLAYLRLDGTIDEIVHLKPHQLSSPDSKSPVRFVLEMNQGWFERHGVEVGMRVEEVTDLRGY